MVAVLRRLSREPLLHFFVSGGLLFALFAWERAGTSPHESEIVVTAGDVDAYRSQLRRDVAAVAVENRAAGGHRGLHSRGSALPNRSVLGLDKDDTIIRRRRSAQKMEFLMGGHGVSARRRRAARLFPIAFEKVPERGTPSPSVRFP